MIYWNFPMLFKTTFKLCLNYLKVKTHPWAFQRFVILITYCQEYGNTRPVRRNHAACRHAPRLTQGRGHRALQHRPAIWLPISMWTPAPVQPNTAPTQHPCNVISATALWTPSACAARYCACPAPDPTREATTPCKKLYRASTRPTPLCSRNLVLTTRPHVS
jgi:hypothetical protein